MIKDFHYVLRVYSFCALVCRARTLHPMTSVLVNESEVQSKRRMIRDGKKYEKLRNTPSVYLQFTGQ